MELTSRLDHFRAPHRERLLRHADAPEWRELLAREDALRRFRADVLTPPDAPGQQSLANEYLCGRNAARVRNLVREGVRDEEALLAVLSDWESALEGEDAFPIVFLGLVVTLDCSFLPRCVYCNQLWRPRRLTLTDWRRLLDEAADPVPPYVYLTGGEPLILGAEIWGDQGLVAHATRLGSAVNINTNAALITPQVALNLVKAGTSKLHVSMDSVESCGLLGAPERTDAVLGGILNVMIAREVLGVRHPTFHVNCVLTVRNLFRFPDLLRFVLGMRRVPEDPRDDDLGVHLIPVGGPENALLRPDAEEWKRFYTETWEEAEGVWRDHQREGGIPPEEETGLTRAFPFTSPYHRVRHGMDLDEYCERAGRGEYWAGALTERCYVAPTQAFVLPDGEQHWCGAHAIRRPPGLGSVTDTGLRENIRSAIPRFADYPNEHCTGCAGATCVINQAAEGNLRGKIREWIAEADRS